MKLTQIALVLGVTCALTACGEEKEASHDTTAHADTAAHSDAASHDAAAPTTESAEPMALKAEGASTDAHDAKAHTGDHSAAKSKDGVTVPVEVKVETPAEETPAGEKPASDASVTATTTMDVTATDVTAAKAQKGSTNMDGSMEGSNTMGSEQGFEGQKTAGTGFGEDEKKLKAQTIGFTMNQGGEGDKAAEAKGEEGHKDGGSH